MNLLTSTQWIRDRVWIGMLIGIAAVAVSLAARVALGDAALGFPFVIFLPPVVLTTFVAGIGPGILAAVLAGIVADVTLIAPRGRVVPDWPEGWLALAFYALTVGLDILIIHGMTTAFGRAAQAEADLRRANEALESRVSERTAALRKQIADRETAEAQVRQMQKMEAVGQLTGGIAHDFNNMLAVVVGSLEMARRRVGEPERLLGSIASAEEGARRASQLVTRLLAFSRQQALEPRALDANALVTTMSELMRRTLGERIEVEVRLAADLWRCFADAVQLENAILNLAVNARDAMPDGGKLTIETANGDIDAHHARHDAEVEPGEYVVICVSDTGAGMPASVIDRAFDPFYTTKEVGKGTGLGLSQVYGFVKQSGGHIAIYSEVGLGTTLRLYLPRNLGAEIAAADGAAPADMPVARPQETVLVVEDEAGVRRMSVDALRELGYVVVQAGDAKEALSLLEVETRVDLMFTDVVMPGLNGRELADAARAIRPELKVVFTSGYTRDPVVTNGLIDPGVVLLAKPFTLSALASKMRDALDGRGHGVDDAPRE